MSGDDDAVARALLLTARLAQLPAEFAAEAGPLCVEASRSASEAVRLRALFTAAQSRYASASAALDLALYEAEAWGLALVEGEAETALAAAARADAADALATQAVRLAAGAAEAALAALVRAERSLQRQRLALVPRRHVPVVAMVVEPAPAPFRARPVPPGTRELKLATVLARERPPSPAPRLRLRSCRCQCRLTTCHSSRSHRPRPVEGAVRHARRAARRRARHAARAPAAGRDAGGAKHLYGREVAGPARGHRLCGAGGPGRAVPGVEHSVPELERVWAGARLQNPAGYR